MKCPWNASRKGSASGSYTSSGAISHLKTCKSLGAAAALEVCNITQEQQVAVKTEKHMNLVEKLERFNSFIAEDTAISTPGRDNQSCLFNSHMKIKHCAIKWVVYIFTNEPQH